MLVDDRELSNLASINKAVQRRIWRDAHAVRLCQSAVGNAELAIDCRAVSADASQPSGAHVV
jgi:hypothetical protein